MKKIVSVLLVMVACVLIAGCGSKKQKLVCKMDIEGVDTTYNVGFSGNMITTMDFQYLYDLSEFNDTQIEGIKKQDFCSSIKEKMPEYKEAFTSCESNIADKSLNVSVVLDVDKIAKNTLEKMGNIETGKEALEAQGFACTIENN